MYRDFVESMMREKEALQGEMDGRLIYGGSDFGAELSLRHGVGAVSKPRGRPRKEEGENK